jgi:hypothetical protein
MAMQTQHTNWQPRSFGLSVGGIFLFIAIWPSLRSGQDVRLGALVLGVALLLSGLVMPAVLRRPYRLWMQLAYVLGWLDTKIILTVVFYTVFVPAAFIMRLIGKDPMNRAFLSKAATYRVLCQPRSSSHMKHQF